MKPRIPAILLAFALAAPTPSLAAEEVLLADGDLSGWEEHAFTDKIKPTTYAVVEVAGAPGNGRVLDALASSSASGYIMQRKLPFASGSKLLLTYRVLAASNPLDEQTKPGDDFPLRVYLTDLTLLGGDSLVLTHTLQTAAGSRWTSPYSGRLASFELYAIARDLTEGQQWLELEVPVGRLWQQAYADLPAELDGISFMVDSDDTKGEFHTQIARISYVP